MRQICILRVRRPEIEAGGGQYGAAFKKGSLLDDVVVVRGQSVDNLHILTMDLPNKTLMAEAPLKGASWAFVHALFRPSIRHNPVAYTTCKRPIPGFGLVWVLFPIDI
jgi:hypothetical protein